jgi:uncharacterized repeat protein (TIGR01451 family)
VVAGEQGRYLITVTNNGPSSSSGFTVTDTLPAGTTYVDADSDTACNAGIVTGTVVCTQTADLADGASATFVIAYTADSTLADDATLTNSVAVDGEDTDDNTANDTDSEDTTVVREADLSITKAASPASVFSGDNITYTVTVTNHGPSVSSGFTVTDELSANVSFVSASAECTHDGAAFGGTVTCVHNDDVGVTGTVTYTIVVKTKFPLAPTTISNTATVAGQDTDPDTTNNTSNTVQTPVVLRRATGTGTMTNSAFQLQTDLGPWTITDFEILLNGQNTIVATNPGQFYFHPRVTNPFNVTTSIDFEMNWTKDFAPQTNGGMPLHAYVRLAGSTTWTDWTPQSTLLCWSANQNTCVNGSDASLTVNNVPANAEVWVTAHLDLVCKSKPYSCLLPNDPLKRPATYSFDSKATVKVAGVPVAESTSEASLVGRGKKVTMVYGTVTGATGAVEDAWVRIKQGTNYALTQTDEKGMYLFFDDQYCTGDGLTACSGWTTQLKFANGTSSATVTVLGNGATQSPTWQTDAGSPPSPNTAGTNYATFNVAKGSAYNKNFKFSN